MGLGKLLLGLAFLIVFCQSPLHSSYEFKGTHYIAEFYECVELEDVQLLFETMTIACEDTGAHVLDSSITLFPGGGCTIVFALSESHASIHTYPEFRACFLDIFTCGDTCDIWKFANVLHRHLEPQRVNERVLERGSDMALIYLWAEEN